MKGLLASCLLVVMLAGCAQKPEPQWTTTLLAAKDRAPPECKTDHLAPMPKTKAVSPEDAARLQSQSYDVIAVLKKDKAVCGAWAEQQRPKR